MSKYRPLSDRLSGHAEDEWRTSFKDIEKMLGFPLPKGARTGRAWWDKAAPPGWEVGEVDQGHRRRRGGGWRWFGDGAGAAKAALGAHFFSTKLSITFFSPALSKATVSLLPSTPRTSP
jgi:hypothetical protein